MVTCQIMSNKNLYQAKTSGLYLPLSELKNKNRLQNDSANSIKNSMDGKKKLRETLDLGENVLLLAERIKKMSDPGKFYKSSIWNIACFNKESVFVLSNKRNIEGKIFYWLIYTHTQINFSKKDFKDMNYLILKTT